MRIVYYSGYRGNTRKVAIAIAEKLNIKAEQIGKDKIAFSEPVDLLFIGSGVYFGKPHKTVIALIKELSPSIVKSAAAFGTYGNQSNVGEQINKLLLEQGIHTLGEPFVCQGSFVGTGNQGHPNPTDLENAQAFAASITAKILF